MDSFLSLFDPGPTSKVKHVPKRRCSNDAPEGNGNPGVSPLVKHEREVSPGRENLPPEPELGNIEYKLKLVNVSANRFEHLVTQVFIRVRTGCMHGYLVVIGISTTCVGYDGILTCLR